MAKKTTVEIVGMDTVLQQIKSACDRGVPAGLTETMDDLKMCAQGFAPKDVGHLEQAVASKVVKNKHGATGSVTFHTTAKKYDYALIMHEGFYNLGPGSQSKSGGSSKFGAVTHTVGRKYLEAPFLQLVPAYVKHISKRVMDNL